MIITDDPQIVKYLDKRYFINEHRFYTKFEKEPEWGLEITKDITMIFAYDFEFCRRTLRSWAFSNGMVKDAWHMAYHKHKLDIAWSPDFREYIHINSNRELINYLIDEIIDDLQSSILTYYRGRLTVIDDFLGILRCIGYTRSRAEYSDFGYSPRQFLVSMNYSDILEERKKNPYWKEWVLKQGDE
jgi:hypothetical protein